MLIAITNDVSPKIADVYDSIDFGLAQWQQEIYRQTLAECGVEVKRLRVNESFPDGCFVEDTGIVVDEAALITSMKSEWRRGEPEAIAEELKNYRETVEIISPATIDGGDVLRLGRQIFVGLSERTNVQAINELERILSPLGYIISPVEVLGGLHLKTACTALDEETLLINPDWVGTTPFRDFKLLEVADGEPVAANTICVNGKIFMAAGFPKTAEMVQKHFDQTETIDISEFIKADAGLSCLSIIFEQPD
jgi:dimethylargininase